MHPTPNGYTTKVHFVPSQECLVDALLGFTLLLFLHFNNCMLTIQVNAFLVEYFDAL